MTTDPTRSVVDADGHVLEPADTWLKYLDPTYRSALMANRCIREMLTGLAMYKKGMRAPHDLDPFTSGADR